MSEKIITIQIPELKIAVFGDNNQFCTNHFGENDTTETCMYYEDSEMFCLLFYKPNQQNKLEFDEENSEFLRCKECLAAEVKIREEVKLDGNS